MNAPVFVAYDGEYEHRRAIGVYTSEERAQAAHLKLQLDRWKERCKFDPSLRHQQPELEDPDVEEWTLDAPPMG